MRSMKIVPLSDPARASNDEPRTTLRIENGGAPAMSDPPADTSTERRAVLERELDRLQQAIQVDQQSASQHLNWLLLSQALFINAFLIVLVLGGAVPAVAARWLLLGLAALGAVAAVVLHSALRRTCDEVAMLRVQRRAVEITLQKEFARVPMFPPSRNDAPPATLPLIFLGGWAVLVAYALLAPR